MDEELRRRARAARAEIEAQVDVEAELAGRPTRSTTSGIAPITPLPPRGRIVAVAGSIAAVAVAIIGGVVLFRGPESIETSEPSTPIVTTSISSPASTTNVPGATTTVVPATSTTSTTTSTPASPTGRAAVSYLDPPPTVTLTSLAEVPVPEPTVGGYQVAIGDLGVAVASWPYSANTGRVDVIGFDGMIRTIDDLPTNGALAYGPGDVVYTTLQSESTEDFAVVAMPLSGDRVGEIVSSEPAAVLRYVEYPPSSFGHGAEGVAMRRDGGEVAIGYVDVDGNPTTLDSEPTFYEVDDELRAETPRGNGVVTSSDGDSWTLSIDTHPEPASTFVGPSPAAPTNDGNGVYWTHIGPDLAPDDAHGEPSQWVVAHLGKDGSATWWSLPDGWTIAASDIWGTVAVRQQGEQLEVALVDFTPDEQPAPTTTTTTTTMVPPTVPTTTVPTDAAVPWRSLTWEATRIERNCSDDEFVGCTQILVDQDGSTVSYDPTTRTLTRHSTPPAVTVIPVEYGDVYVELLGPDDVVYLNVDPSTPVEDPTADLVAVSLAPDDAGRELGRWAGITDRVGDQDLVATRDGLVVVNCCDAGRLRPAPDAEVVLRWLGRDGADASMSGPVMRTEVDAPTLTVHRENDLPAGTRSWTFEPPSDWQPRGMPTVIPTFDGGFVATTSGGVDQTVVRGWADGTIDMVTIDADPDGTAVFPILDPNGRATVAEGDRFARFEPVAERAEFWAGRPEYGDDGAVTMPDLDTAIDGAAAWAHDPIAFANAVAGRIEVNERRTIELRRPSDADFLVSVTTSNHFDDSVFATRLELTLNRDDDGRFRFLSGQWAQTCQPGRGQQEFGAELCV